MSCRHDLDALLGQLGRQRLEILFVQFKIDRDRLELLLREEPAVIGRLDHQPHTRLVHQLGRHQSLDSPVTVEPPGPGSELQTVAAYVRFNARSRPCIPGWLTRQTIVGGSLHPDEYIVAERCKFRLST
jgi:hypothetical protein